MLNTYCLASILGVMLSYYIFTTSYPIYVPYNEQSYIIYENCHNIFVLFLSTSNHLMFLSGAIVLLLLVTTSFSNFKRYVYIPLSVLQIIYLLGATYIIGSATCSTTKQLTDYYNFINLFFWLSFYGLYLKLILNLSDN